MAHEEALQWLQEMYEANISPIHILSLISITYVNLTGLKLCSRPELKQSLVEIESPDKELCGEFTYFLRHSLGIRSVVLKTATEWYLSIEDVAEDYDQVIRTRIYMPLDVRNDDLNKAAFENMLAEFQIDRDS